MIIDYFIPAFSIKSSSSLKRYTSNVFGLPRSRVSAAALNAALESLQLHGHVIVHASLRSFGFLEGGATTLLQVLCERTDTLVAPAFYYDTMVSIPHYQVPREQFHRYSPVSPDIGRLPLEMVNHPSAFRSFHPTLSFVAIGEYAQQITQLQSLQHPYQPIAGLYDLDAWVLLIGVDFDSNTTIHYAEYRAGVPLLTRHTMLNGELVPMAFPNCSADFGRLVQEPVRSVMAGRSLLRLYRLRDLVDQAMNLLEQDPEALLCSYRYCRCKEVRKAIREQGLQPRRHEGLSSLNP